MHTVVSERHTAYFLQAMLRNASHSVKMEAIFGNIGKYLPDYTASFQKTLIFAFIAVRAPSTCID